MNQSHTVIVDGHSIHYRQVGEGPPVLLLHGWPTSSFLWRNVMPAMANRRRLIAIDLPGFGQSDKPLDIDYNVDFYTSIIDGRTAQILDHQAGSHGGADLEVIAQWLPNFGVNDADFLLCRRICSGSQCGGRLLRTVAAVRM